jgi:hypothetical protein
MPSKERQKMYQAGDMVVSGDVTFSGEVAHTGAVLDTVEAVTATADGLTTGLISRGSKFVVVTSASAGNIVRLPPGLAADVGMTIKGWVGTNGCEMRTNVGDSATINNVDCDDSANEAAIPATTFFTCTLVALDTWILETADEEGVAISGIIPDAQ